MSIKKNIFAPLASGLGATRRAAMTLLVMLLTATTAWAQTTSTINVGGTDYTLFTGFTATDGNGNNWTNLVDGNTSTDWIAEKTINHTPMPGEPDPDPDAPPAPTGDFAGGTEDPAFVEFHADAPIIPKGYVLTCDDEDAGFWKPVQWALKARLNEGDAWITIHSSNTTLGAGKTFEIPCSNDGNNKYQYFRFEVYEVGATTIVDLDELQFYGLLPTYTHLTVKAATCTATGIKRDCYRRNSDGKYFTDETGATELAESDVIAPMIPHSGEHHEATDVNIEYWQCSMCGTYFSDEGCTTEITEEQTKIYRTITIDGSISSLVTCDVSQALAGETIALYVSDLIDASTLKVNNGAVELTAMTDIQYTFTMPAADVTVTAEVAQSNADGDVLTGSIRHTVTIPHGASITLNDAAISGSIVCEGSATITLVGTNSVSGATNTAGIQIGGSGTTLTIRGDGSLTTNGGAQSAGIGLSRAWNPDDNVIGGDIVIEGGNITANGGGQWGAGIGTGVIYGNGSAKTARIGNITIKGGSVKATGGSEADGIGTGYAYPLCTNAIGTVTIYDGIDKVDASSIKNSGSIVYKHETTDVTASKSDYFTIIENGNRRIIVQKVTPTIADVPDQTYTGSAITPEPTVIAGSLSLTKGTDYVYSYTNNTNVGTAKVGATFQGVYASLGYVEKEFTIAKATPAVTAPTAYENLIYNGSAQALVNAGSTDFGTLLYSLDGETYSEDIPTATSAGTHTVYYKVAGDNNHNDVFGSLDVTIAPKAVTNEDITVTIPSQTWTGNEIAFDETAVVVKDGETTLALTTDYTVTAPTGTLQDTGDYPVTITGAGEYAGEVVAMFTIKGKTVTVKNDKNEDVPAATGDAEITQDQDGLTLTLTTPTESTTPHTVNVPQPVEVDHVTIDRTFEAGKACTLYLPFSIAADKIAGGTFNTFTGVDTSNPTEWIVQYSPVAGDIEANTPYIFLPNGTNGGKITVNNGSDKVSICTANQHTTEKDQWDFIGTYERIKWTHNTADPEWTQKREDEIGSIYGFAAEEKSGATVGQFVQVTDNVWINPMRAYLKHTVVAPARSMDGDAATTELPSSMKVVIVAETTGITSMEDVRGKMSDAWYSLDGRKLQGKPTTKGMYIHNGRKEVVK